MKDDLIKYYKVIGRLQKQVSRAESLREALQEGLKIIHENFPSDAVLVWYKEDDAGTVLHPYYWLGDRDYMACCHNCGSGAVGRVFQSQQAERSLEYVMGSDPETEADFSGIRIKSMICVPFSTQHENLGCIQMISSTDNYTEEIADAVEILAYMIAVTIDENEKFGQEWRFRDVLISARDVKKSFQNGDTVTQVLNGVNLDIYKGELLVVLGESGCGKSTFLNIIGGLERADSGTFSFCGEELSGASEDKLTAYRRDNIGFIFQSYNLMPNLTARQNLDLIGELVKNPMDSNEALEKVGLSAKKDNYPSQLSGGQQQRVSIARALIKRPTLIFADEPTAALDYATSIEVLSVLEKVMESGTTLVMVTHNEEITRMADRVVRFRQGKTQEITINRHRVPAVELVW